MDFSEKNYDEFGIQKRWQCAHGYSCENIWISGPLAAGLDPEYWPKLHFKAAVGANIEELKEIMVSMTDEELSQQDLLGRTAAHWLFIHPNKGARHELISLLLARGVDLNTVDEDGLTPVDWQTRCDLSVLDD